jgi:hypothetical protein
MLGTLETLVITEFCSQGNPDIELTVQKDATAHRAHLLRLTRHRRLGKDVSIVYIYSLVNSAVNYPDANGRVVYIGQALRQSGKETTGKRFSQHISKAAGGGADTGTNYVLSRYYWLGQALNVKIYIADNMRFGKSASRLESDLINQHMKQFGAPPIGQGAGCVTFTYQHRWSLGLDDLLA